MPRIAVYALLTCVLALAAAVLSFANGSWLGIVWVMVLGVSSNIAWFYWRKAQMDRQRAAAVANGDAGA
ncbi:hypothetical protein [Streptomyces alkaliterrae]|uniref:Uncharacterized protein n=1 Tax=Streptomyces alkaliterrae TaxID=2213162 RepID=A0A5P0YVE4_9ACTN|nr:hypothetical protein [Streptomyces alkaliterrae]MBB1256208.1 hypothetical protein [Streptomyces alkaliterrae]MBB1261197.1 hypothetical protein [Streptomyces alkaliterrae]MQS04265.1 hypothetical protein [Streptomyces alkaliterrae]